jgi:hypothetical protein
VNRLGQLLATLSEVLVGLSILFLYGFLFYATILKPTLQAIP